MLVSYFSLNRRNPTPSPVTPPVGDLEPVTWSRFTPDDLTYMWLGTDVVENRKNYRQDYYALLQYYYPLLAFGDPMPFDDELF